MKRVPERQRQTFCSNYQVQLLTAVAAVPSSIKFEPRASGNAARPGSTGNRCNGKEIVSLSKTGQL